MKTKAELQPLIDQIANPSSPVGMDAVYVHALILDRLENLQQRLAHLEGEVAELRGEAARRKAESSNS